MGSLKVNKEKEVFALNKEKVLVCITIQHNSRRLIEKGANLCRESGGELHILHIENGKSIFSKPEVTELLEELFKYGKDMGGEVHFFTDDRVAERIVAFINEFQITTVVLGETLRSKLYKLLRRDISRYISKETKDLEQLVIKREVPDEGRIGITENEIASSKE